MKLLRLLAFSERKLQSIQGEFCIKALRGLAAEIMPGIDLNNRNQIDNTYLEQNLCAIRRQYLIDRSDRMLVNMTGNTLCWITRNHGAWILVDCS